MRNGRTCKVHSGAICGREFEGHVHLGEPEQRGMGKRNI